MAFIHTYFSLNRVIKKDTGVQRYGQDGTSNSKQAQSQEDKGWGGVFLAHMKQRKVKLDDFEEEPT